jgi:SAM-dependent methyltransferase
MTDEADATSRFNARVPNIARVYDYWLGGKDNFAADREVGDKTLKAWPQLAVGVRANRAFLIRAVDYLAEQEGIRQFLDIGSGIPASGNTHEVAQSVAPESRIVYVDNDPIVLSHARALLRSSPQGACDYIDGDLRDASQLLELAAKTIDFSKPVAVMLLAVLHWVPDAADPHAIVRELLDAVVPGSYLVLSHPALDLGGAGHGKMVDLLRELMPVEVTHRTLEQVTPFFDGTELVEPGLVRIPEWRPESDIQARSPGALWAGVGRVLKLQHQAERLGQGRHVECSVVAEGADDRAVEQEGGRGGVGRRDVLAEQGDQTVEPHAG